MMNGLHTNRTTAALSNHNTIKPRTTISSQASALTPNTLPAFLRDIDGKLNRLTTHIESIDAQKYADIAHICNQFVDNVNAYVQRLRGAVAYHNSATGSPIAGEFMAFDDEEKIDYAFPAAQPAAAAHSTIRETRSMSNATLPAPAVPSKPTTHTLSQTLSANTSRSNSPTPQLIASSHRTTPPPLPAAFIASSVAQAIPMSDVSSSQHTSSTAIPQSSHATSSSSNHMHTSSTAPPTRQPPPPPPPKSYNTPGQHTPGQHSNPITIDDSAPMHVDDESDEAMARRLQQELEQQDAAERAKRDASEQDDILKLTCSCHMCGVIDMELMEIDTCTHRLCNNCLRAHLLTSLTSESHTADTKCPVRTDAGNRCKSAIPDWMQRRVLTNEQFDTLQQLALQAYFERSGSTAVTCPNKQCGNTFEAVAGTVDDTRQDGTVELGVNGQPVSREAYQHRAAHRFRCSKCAVEFCSGCSAHPYHLGFTCEQYKAYLTANKCRFCENAITPEMTEQLQQLINGNHNTKSLRNWWGKKDAHNNPAGAQQLKDVPSDICSNAECYAKRLEVCDKILPCKHACNGIANEKICTGCLHNQCDGVDGSAYCSICYVDALLGAPCLKLNCGHYYHYKCVLSKITQQWTGARITFGFLDCPECRAEISHVSLEPVTYRFKQLKAVVQEKAVARLKYEGCEQDDALVKASSRYYRQPIAYAMDRFAYYPCAKCKQPYFGGRRQCEEVKENDDKFNPDELICGGCASGPNALQCNLHGKDYIEFKCKFCCGIATYYCWGSTHFCEQCHSKQTRGEYVTRIPVDKLPKCGGAKVCPLGIDHPPAGNEYALGCSICRPRFN